MSLNVDAIIVGRGLAGSILGIQLVQAGLKIAIVDDEPIANASRIAAGLAEPVTGKRLALTWRAAELLAEAHRFYAEMAEILGGPFYKPSQTLRIFQNEEERERYEKKRQSAEYQSYFCEIQNEFELNAPFGTLGLKGGFVLNTPQFLDLAKVWLNKHATLIRAEMTHDELAFSLDGVAWRGILATKIIFAAGYHVAKWPMFQKLPYRLAKGEVLSIKMTDFPLKNPVVFGKWLTPFQSPNHFRLGATYEWDDLSERPTAVGRAEIESAFRQIINRRVYETLDHQAGVRCILKDNKPVLGFLKMQETIGIFSGFSSKGVLWIPYFAKQLCSEILGNGRVDCDVSVNRFYD